MNPVYNLERDIKKTWWMVDKVRRDEVYAQNLYAAFCNNEFVPKDIWGILKNVRWSCTWRYAGGIVAEIREDSDYMDWYCSGINLYNELFVPESCIVPVIAEDLDQLGWLVLTSGSRVNCVV
jgi:hypothetical protein